MQTGVVIFDLDGTLFQGHRVTVPATQAAMSELGLQPATPEQICACVGEPMDRFCRLLAPGASPDQLQQLAGRISAHERRLIPRSGRLYDGVAKLLDELEARGFELALCSNGSRDYIDAVLGACGVSDRFRYVVGREPGKSKIDHVREIMRAVAGSFGIVVGDRLQDLEAARANGLLSIGVTYGYGKNEVQAADFRAAAPVEILGHVLRSLLFLQIEEQLVLMSKESARIVGITGVDTSGKSTFARLFSTYLATRGHRSVLIHLDDFHNPRSLRTQGRTEVEAYIDHAFNLQLLCDALLEPARQRKPVDTWLTLLDLDRDTFTNRRHYAIDEASIVIVEGVLLFREPVDRYFDLRVFLDIGFDEVLRRAEERDVPVYGSTFLERYRQKYIPIQQWFLTTHDPRARADVVIDNTDYQRPCALRGAADSS